MDKMMHAKDSENKVLELQIDRLFDNHFRHVVEKSALHASLALLKIDLKKILGLNLTKETENDSE